MSPAALARRHGGEVLRFLVVGGASALLNTLIIVALTELASLPYTMSYWVCFGIVTLWGFLLNRSWSFRVSDGRPGTQMGRYYAVTLLGTVLAFFIIKAMVAEGVVYWLACYLAAGLIAPANFIAHRWFSFAR